MGLKVRKRLALFLTTVLMVSTLPWSGDSVSASGLSDVQDMMETTEPAEESENVIPEGSETDDTSEYVEEPETEEPSEAVESTETEETQEETEASGTEEGEEHKEDIEEEQEAAANDQENQEALHEGTEGEAVSYADIIASGSDNNITWVIDADGKLTISGTGDFSSSVPNNANLWGAYCGQITSAELNVTGMVNASYMFEGCRNLDSVDLSGFDTGNVTNMDGMFWGCSSLVSVDVSGFDTSNVMDMGFMFVDCSSLASVDVSGFDTSNVTDMGSMFSGCSSLASVDVSGFDTSNVMDMRYMFGDCSSLTSVDVSGFDTSNVTDMCGMFSDCSSLTSVDVSGFDTSNVTDMGVMFYGCSSLTSVDVSSFSTSNVTAMAMMFNGCSSLTSADVSGFDTSNVTNMGWMFISCSSLTSVDVSGFDTSNVTDMELMFGYCSNLTSVDVSGFDTSNVTDMRDMFSGCSSLASVDVSGFDMSNVTDMAGMFRGCSSLTSVDVSGFDTSNVTAMYSMFSGCSSLASVDVSGFDTSNVTDMAGMFSGCSSLTSVDMSNFDMRNVAEMGQMFDYCINLTTIQTPYNISQAITLPSVSGAVWRLPDGTEVTELPQNLDYSVVITRHDNPQIITTTTELNMEDVVRVKYVPYSYTIVTDNKDEENKVTFSLEAGELPRGLQIYPATGEIYGVPMEAGEFPITVKATFSDPQYEPSYAELTVFVKDNTDGDVYNASDAGYELLVPVGERAGEDSNDFLLREKGDQLFVSAGEVHEFIALWLNGERLQEDVDYTKESGSTRITILAQTFENRADHNGTNTLAMEFRIGGDESKDLKRTAQNFRMDYQQSNDNENDDNSGGESDTGENEGNGTSGGTGGVTVISEANGSTETIIYTVVSGDTLWKIALQYYGAGTYWQKIYADNADIISDPDKIYAGQKLTIYLTQETGATSAGDGNTYTVASGDTLWMIAQKIYGKGRYWRKIYNANTDIIADPERIYAGQVLVIPVD